MLCCSSGEYAYGRVESRREKCAGARHEQIHRPALLDEGGCGVLDAQNLLDIRMDKAKNLLINAPSLSVAEVAEKCGYTQISNFTRAFKNYFDLMPSDLRAKYETDDDQQQSTL